MIYLARNIDIVLWVNRLLATSISHDFHASVHKWK